MNELPDLTRLSGVEKDALIYELFAQVQPTSGTRLRVTVLTYPTHGIDAGVTNRA